MPGIEPTELHRSLHPLEGDWTGEGEVFPNPWGPSGPTQCTWKFRMAHRGLHMIHDYRELRDGCHLFEAHGVISVDPASQSILWFLFDDYGFPPLEPARGVWTGNRLDLIKSTPRGIGRTQLQLEDGTLLHTVEFKPTSDGEYIPVAKSRLRQS